MTLSEERQMLLGEAEKKARLMPHSAFKPFPSLWVFSDGRVIYHVYHATDYLNRFIVGVLVTNTALRTAKFFPTVKAALQAYNVKERMLE